MRTLVFLIGTGPGDPGLLTVRGRRCLERAEVVVYDRAVHPRIVSLAPAGAERIDVGRPAREAVDHDAISMLLAEKAREGKIVARLKQGDPFVFDRGGEEALFLHEHGIPFEVVPGVPSVIGISAYAGVPLTYSGAGDTLTLVRGHGTAGRPQINWKHVAESRGAVVSYGSRSDLVRMVHELLDAGRASDDLGALVLHGTLPGQRTTVGTLQELHALLTQTTEDGPGTLIVGSVVGLRDHVRWFDSRPLFGRRVLVTRSRHQAAELVDLLEAEGAEAIEAPMLRVAPLDRFDALDESIDTLSQFDVIVFSTINGIDGFMRRLFERGRDSRALGGPLLCAAGIGTSARLSEFGVRADLVAEGVTVDDVVAAIDARTPVAQRRVLIPATLGPRDSLAEALAGVGAQVTLVPAFQTLAVEEHAGLDVYGELLQHSIDVVTFTSGAAVRAFAALYGHDQAADLLSHTSVATLGPATAEAVHRLGVTRTITPAIPSLPALVDAIRAHFQ